MRLWSVVLGLALLAAACGTGDGGPEAVITVQEGGAPAATTPASTPADDEAAGAAAQNSPTGTPPAPTMEPQEQSLGFVLNPPAWRGRPEVLPFAGTTLPEIEARAAIVVDEASGAILWERNAYEPLPPASLTKIVTALVALERGVLDAPVTVDVDSREMPGSSVMGLQPGDTFTMRDLLFGLMLPSGNDAALAIGRAISGSDEAFVAEMNAFSARLGLVNTNWANPHGLTAEGHVTSAFDLAMLSRYAMSLPDFVPFAVTREWTALGSRTIEMGNLNALLRNYEGADGIKVGFTNKAGRTLVASATRNGNRVYVVLLNAPNSQADAAALLDWAFEAHHWENLQIGPRIIGLARDVMHTASMQPQSE